MSAVVQMRSPSAPASDLDAADLLALARSRSPEDRQRLLMGVTAFCKAAAPSARSAPVLSEIFLVLAAQAERDIRLLLAEQLAGVDWAPPALINMLALDEIEIARPVIAASPLLKDADLIRLLVEATLDHQIAVARRPGLSSGVVDAILERGDPVTLTALASNRSADISQEALRRLVRESRRIAGLRAPLTRHPRLNADLANELYQWVGQALRQAIGERFRVDDVRLNEAVQQASQQTSSAGAWQPVSSPRRTDTDRDRQEMEQRLVDKLHAAGQLRPGLLIRALREHRLELFERTLARLGGFTPDQVRRAIQAQTAEPLYLACMAVGVDKAVFPSLLVEVRKLADGRPADGGWTATSLSVAAASRAFSQMIDRANGV